MVVAVTPSRIYLPNQVTGRCGLGSRREGALECRTGRDRILRCCRRPSPARGEGGLAVSDELIDKINRHILCAFEQYLETYDSVSIDRMLEVSIYVKHP
jgi:hypothetical protein